MPETIELSIWQQQQDFMADAFNTMRNNQFLTDVTIVCSGKMLPPAHRTLLCAASPFFQAMFKSECKESLSGTMELPTIPLEAGQMVLDFIYTGKIPNLKGKKDKLKCLMEASHLLQIDFLFQYCLQLLAKSLSANYFLELWTFSELYNDKELRCKIVSFVAENFFQASSTDDFCNMTISQLLEVIQHPGEENWATDIILTGVMSWVKFNREQRNCNLLQLLEVIEMRNVTSDLLKIVAEDTVITSNSSARDIIHAEMYKRFADKCCEPRLLCFDLAEPRSLYIYNVNATTWSNQVPLPNNFCSYLDAATVSFNGNVYFLGGSRTRDPTAAVFKYSFVANMCTRLNDLQVAVSKAGATELDNYIYVVGGKDDLTGKTFQRVNTFNSSTEVLSLTNFPHTSPVVFAFQNQVYAAGSKDKTQRSVERYDTVVDQWTVVTEIPGHIWWCRGALCKQKLLIFRSGDRSEDSGIHTFDLISGKWDVICKAGGPSEEVTGVWASSENKILVAGEDQTICTYAVDENVWLATSSENEETWHLVASFT